MTLPLVCATAIPVFLALIFGGDIRMAAAIPAVGLMLMGVFNNPRRRMTSADFTAFMAWIVCWVVGCGFAVWGSP